MAAQIAIPTLESTLPLTFRRAARERANEVAIREKRLGIWHSISFGELWRDAAEAARGLIGLGFAAGETGLILSGNRAAWVRADMALLLAGGISAGVHSAISPERLTGLLRLTGASVLFVEDEEQLDKANRIRAACPALRTIVLMSQEDGVVAGANVLSFEQLAAHAAPEVDLQARIETVGADETAILVFTSGSTGEARVVPLSHRNVCSAIALRLGALPGLVGDERLALLPLSLSVERLHGLYAALASGTVVHFPEGADTAFENLRELAPSTVSAIPRVWERFYSGIMLALSAATPLQRFAYAKAIGLGGRVAETRAQGRSASPMLRFCHAIADRLVLRGVRKAVGLDRARWLMTSSAPLSAEITQWYAALGLPMVELYGQAETAATVAITPLGGAEAWGAKAGRVGRVLPGVEVRAGEGGEILVRGAGVFAGYLGDEAESARVLSGGWFHTGDIGSVDAQGFLTIADRMKNVVTTASGQRIMPSEIENRLNLSPYVADAVVIGDGRADLGCIVLIDYDNVVRFAQDKGVPFTNFQSLSRAGAVNKLIGDEIARVNAEAVGPGIARFRLIDVELLPGDEELTPAIKLRRRLIQQRFGAMIDAMYL